MRHAQVAGGPMDRPPPARRRAGGRERAPCAARPARGQRGAPRLTGAYKPLTERDMQRIYATALTILENIGIAEPIPEILHYALPGGCYQDERGRLRFRAPSSKT